MVAKPLYYHFYNNLTYLPENLLASQYNGAPQVGQK